MILNVHFCKHTKYDVLIYNDNTQNINKDTKLQTYNNIHNYHLQSTYKCMNGVDMWCYVL
jgi:hypothetical protein